MAGSLAVIASSAATRPRGNTGFVSRLLEWIPRLFSSHWPALHLSEAHPETVFSRHGAVEIRQTHSGFSVQTCVKGEAAQARTTALRRLGNYLGGRNRNGTRLRAAGPLVQREEAPGRWLVCVGLPDVEDAFVAAVSRNGKVRIRPAQSEVLAILAMSGRPTPEAVARGEAAIRAALTNTEWLATGRPMMRMDAPPSVLPFMGHFEVALRVATQ